MVKPEDQMMIVRAARNWLIKNASPKATVACNMKKADHSDTVLLTIRDVKISFEDSLKLMGILDAIRPEGVKIAMEFPDNTKGSVAVKGLSYGDD